MLVRIGLQRQSQSFGVLLRSLPGIDPGVVAECLERIASGTTEPLSIRATAATLLMQAETPLQPQKPTAKPIPHPLDCYWPNDPLTLRTLTWKLGRLTPPGGTIVYLGWPNAFADARSLLPNRKHLLLESNAMRSASHRSLTMPHEVLTLDVSRDELPEVRGDTIIADPPWYPDELMAFLWAAARLAKPGAHVLLALPPDGTRPGIDQERRALLDWAVVCGLRPRELRPGVLGYLSPPFERAALAARGVAGTPSNWRYGDLLVCAATPTELPPRPRPERDDWLSWHLSGLPIRIRADSGESSGSISGVKLLESIVDGDVLDTVSRRAAIRQRARVWTSCNRVYTSTHPAVLAAIVDAMEAGLPIAIAAAARVRRALTRREREAVLDVSMRLRRLVGRELREHGLH